MMQHGGMGFGRVAGQDRAHDLAVFGMGLRQTAGRAELRPPEMVEPTPKLEREFLQHRIVRAGVEHRVELVIGVAVAGARTLCGDFAHAFVKG